MSTIHHVISMSGRKIEYRSDVESYESGDKICQASGDKGIRLLKKTLANHLIPRYWPMINDNKLFFCENVECGVYYFNSGKDLYFGKEDIQSVVMHKMQVGEENRPACYCKNVLESQILEELLEKQCCDSLIDIQNFTGANTGKNCAITNPTGRCCGKQLKEIIEYAMGSRTGIEAPLLEEAISCCNTIEKNTVNAIEDAIEEE